MQDRYDPDEHPGSAHAPRRWRDLERRTRRRIVVLGTVLVLAAAALAAVLTVPLPVSIIAPRIVQAVESRLGRGYDVSIGHARIDHRGGHLGFRLSQFEIRDPAGNVVLRVPEAVVGLSGNFMIGSRVSATSVRLVEPHLTMRIEKTGEVSLAAAEGAPPLFHLPAGELPQGAPAQLFGLLAAADVTADPAGPLATLRSIDIARAQLVVDDQRRNTVDRLDRVDIKVTRQPRDAGLVMSAVSSDPADHWSVTATLSGTPGRPRDLDVGFQDLSMSRLAYEAMRGRSPAVVSGTLSGHLFLRIAPDASVPVGDARIDVADLDVSLPQEPAASVDLASARVEAHWDGVAKRLTVADVDLAGRVGHAHFAGEATPVPGEPQTWDYRLAGSNIVLPAVLPGARPLPVDAVELEGRLDRDAPRLTIRNASLKGAQIAASGGATVELGAEGPEGELALSVGRTTLAALLSVWPAPVATGARTWLVDHVGTATVGGLTLAVDGVLLPTPQSAKPTVKLAASFGDAAVELGQGLPPIAGAAGHLSVENRAFETRVTSGSVRLDDQAIALKDARFALADVFVAPPQGVLALHGVGSVAAFGTLLATPALSRLALPGLDLRHGTGTVDATVTLRGPMTRDTRIAGLTADLKASVQNGALDHVLGGHRLGSADLDLAIDGGGAKLQGSVHLDGSLVSLAAQAARRQGGGFGKTTVTASFDPSKVRGLSGLTVHGPVSARLALPEMGSLAGATVEADLTGATAALPGVLAKPAGSPGRVAFQIQHGSGGHWLLDDFTFDAAPAALHGAVELDDDGGFVGAKLPLFKVSAGDDVRLQVDRSGGGYRVAIRGGALDLRPFLHSALADAGETPGPDVDLAAKIGTAVGYSGVAVAGLDLKLSRQNGRLAALTLAGRLGEERIAGSSDPPRRRITVATGNAGAALAFFGIYRRMRGGELVLDLRQGPAATRGVLTIHDFGIAGEAAFSSVLPGSGADTRITRFSRTQAQFRLVDGRIIIDDGAIWGPELGATLDGQIDYRKDRLDVRGTFVPAYLLNNLFSRLPIIGAILGGGANEGLVGVTFQVNGALESPVLRVNPISMVAPGFLRKLFQFREADLGAQPRGLVAAPPADGEFPPVPSGPAETGSLPPRLPPMPVARPR